MKIGRWMLAIAAVLAVGLFLGLFQEGIRPVTDMTSHSTYSTDPGGTAAFYRLVGEAGHDVERNTTPFAQLQPRPGAVVVLLRQFRGMEGDLTPEMKSLVELSRRGQNVVLFGVEHLSAPQASVFGLRVVLTEDPSLDPANPSLQLTSWFSEPGDERIVGEGWIPLLGGKDGAFASIRHFDQGWIVACVSADAFMNQNLGQSGHAELGLKVVDLAAAGGKAVAFDETLHGYSEGDSLWTRLGTAGRATVYQALLVFAVLVFSTGKRFGYPLRRRPKQPHTGEYIEAIARLYERAKAPGLALTAIRRASIRKMAAIVQLPGTIEEEKLLQRLPVDLRSALQEFDNVAGSEPNQERAVQATAALDREIERFRSDRSTKSPFKTY